MDRKTVIKTINQQQFESGLIIDDNQQWEHYAGFDRIKKYAYGDLHDFFDLINDEQLFDVINEQYDYIFIGELFHVINLQTIIYNLEKATSCLNNNGVISICINQEGLETDDVSYQKIIGRLEHLDGFKVKERLDYVDEEAKKWTMLNLQKLQSKQVQPDGIADAIIIGEEIATYLNQGKNLGKLKAGFLQSHSKLPIDAFKAVYTTSDEMLGLYLQNQIVELKPCFKKHYVYNLADFIFTNRKAISGYANIDNLQQGNFVIAYEEYNKCAIVKDQQFIASYAHVFEQVWNTCLKQKITEQLKLEIENLKE